MIDFSKTKLGETVKVDIEDPVFRQVAGHVARWLHRPDFRARIDYLEKNYDEKKAALPLYYCNVHRRLEDGAHRYFLARRRGQKTMLITVRGRCHHFRPAIFTILSDLIKVNNLGNRKDAAWLGACRDKKWVHLDRTIDYGGLIVLDVGSHCGFMCLSAVFAGASRAVGIEIRPDLVAIAKTASETLKITDRASFVCADWLRAKAIHQEFDVVHCMGLLHYFAADRYPTALTRLAEAAKKTLALEMRLSTAPESRLTVSGIQTLPTHSWLTHYLGMLGFHVVKTFAVDGLKRQLWIMERT